MNIGSSGNVGELLDKMMKFKPIVLLLFILLITSFKPYKAKDPENSSVIFVKINSYVNGYEAYGGNLKIRNIKTNKVYKSPNRNGYNNYSPYVLIKNVPIGEYFFEEVSIDTGTRLLILQYSSMFARINIDQPMIYFLGHYHINKLTTTTEKRYQVLKQNNYSAEKIFEDAKGKFRKRKNLKLNSEHKLFSNDSLILYFENRWR